MASFRKSVYVKMNDEQVESFVVEAVSFGSAKIGRNRCERIANPLSSTDTQRDSLWGQEGKCLTAVKGDKIWELQVPATPALPPVIGSCMERPPSSALGPWQRQGRDF